MATSIEKVTEVLGFKNIPEQGDVEISVVVTSSEYSQAEEVRDLAQRVDKIYDAMTVPIEPIELLTTNALYKFSVIESKIRRQGEFLEFLERNENEIITNLYQNKEAFLKFYEDKPNAFKQVAQLLAQFWDLFCPFYEETKTVFSSVTSIIVQMMDHFREENAEECKRKIKNSLRDLIAQQSCLSGSLERGPQELNTLIERIENPEQIEQDFWLLQHAGKCENILNASSLEEGLLGDLEGLYLSFSQSLADIFELLEQNLLDAEEMARTLSRIVQSTEGGAFRPSIGALFSSDGLINIKESLVDRQLAWEQNVLEIIAVIKKFLPENMQENLEAMVQAALSLRVHVLEKAITIISEPYSVSHIMIMTVAQLYPELEIQIKCAKFLLKSRQIFVL